MAFGGVKGTMSGSGGSTTNPVHATTGTITVAIGDLIVVHVGQRTDNLSNVCSDNLGHTYAAFNNGADAGNGTGRAYWVIATSAGTLNDVTVTMSNTGNQDWAISVVAYEGPFAASPLDANPDDIGDNSAPIVGPTTGMLSQADELVVAWLASANGPQSTLAASGLTVDKVSSTGTGSNTAGGGIASVVVSSTAAVQTTWTNSGTSCALGTASFKKGGPQSHQGNALLVGAGGVVQPVIAKLLATSQTIPTFAGISTLAARGSVIQTGVQPGLLDGISTLTASAGALRPISATVFAGVSSLAAAAFKALNASALLTASGEFTAAHFYSLVPASASFAADSNLAADVSWALLSAQSLLSGDGEITVDATVAAAPEEILGEALLVGDSTLAAREYGYNERIVFSRTLPTAIGNWAGKTIRQRLEPSIFCDIPQGAPMAVQFDFAEFTDGQIEAAYIGHAGDGDPYDFDGNQQQLMFGGAATAAANGDSSVSSDSAVFDLDPTRPLIISAAFSGSTINLKGF